MPLRAPDFESGASADSAIPARVGIASPTAIAVYGRGWGFQSNPIDPFRVQPGNDNDPQLRARGLSAGFPAACVVNLARFRLGEDRSARWPDRGLVPRGAGRGSRGRRGNDET